MNILKNTYRLIAALTLMLFVSTIALPAGLAAASLTCDMDMSHSVPACCATGDMNSHQEEKNDSKDCQHLAFCEQAINTSPSDIPAITQHSKVVLDADFLEVLTTIDQKNDHPPVTEDEPSSLQYHPPIFLLNSTFLN